MTHHCTNSPKRASLEVEVSEISTEELEPLIGLLTELLVGERIKELEQAHSEDGATECIKKEQLKASMAED